MRSSGYQTSGKQKLVAFLSRNGGKQYSVDALHAEMTAEGAVIGKSSLYRQLEALCAKGAVRKFRDENSKVSYFQYIGDDSGCSEHLHLKCEACGKLIHLHCEQARALLSHITSEHGFGINSKKSVLYGLCRDCKEGGRDTCAKK
jgi:Fur family ferric uptake transcriptional regulator